MFSTPEKKFKFDQGVLNTPLHDAIEQKSKMSSGKITLFK